MSTKVTRIVTSGGMEESEELRWPLGEAVMANSKVVPGGFVFFYAAVIGWKWLARSARRGWKRLRPTLGGLGFQVQAPERDRGVVLHASLTLSR